MRPLTALVGILLLAIPLRPQTPAAPAPEVLRQQLINAIRQHSYEVKLDDGKLSGPGAEFLRQQAAAAEFVGLAEEHYVLEVPQFTVALLRLLQPHGFQYLAIESGTVDAHVLSQAPSRGKADAIFDYTRRYPYSLTFFSDQEAQMIADAGAISSGKADPVWGLDQEFGILHVLERLLPLAPSDAAREYTRTLMDRARDNEMDRSKLSDDYHLIATMAPGDLEKLKELYRSAGADARWMVDALSASNRIYRYYKEGQYYQNTAVRERYLKDVFLQNYRRAQELDGKMPKVVLKAGHWHIWRGLNPGYVPSLGDFLSELAVYNGSDAYLISSHVLGPAGGWRDVRKTEWGKLLAEACPQDRFTLVDLRALRQDVRYKYHKVLSDDATSYFFRADAALLLGGAHPATDTKLTPGK